MVFELGGALHGKASEKGLLQLLFDVRFLWDALSGGRPLGDPQPDPVPSAQTPARSAAVCRSHFRSMQPVLYKSVD